MKLSEFQEKWDEICEELVARGRMPPREGLESFVEENTSEDNQVITMSAIFMPPKINRRGKWQAHKRKQAEENNNDSE